MRRLYVTVVAALVATGLLAAMRPAFGATGDESDFHSRVNAERASRGLRPVTLDAGLSGVARRHSQRMADQHHLHHNDNLANEVSGWEELDENVGTGPSVESIHQAFMESSTHRAGILGNYEKVGVGTVWKDGVLWVTEIFYRAKKTTSSSSRTSASAPRASRPAPARPAPAPSRAAAPAPAPASPPAETPAAPVPATTPLGVALPELSTGKLQKLLGDLQIHGPAEPEGQSPDDSAPPATRFGSLLWHYVEPAAL